jgi:hypothetical protein
MVLILYPVARLMKGWRSPVYAFYEPVPRIVHIGGRRCHEFHCLARRCHHKHRRFRDTSYSSSTGTLVLHVKSCWGEDAWNAAKRCRNATDAREKVTKPLLKSGAAGKRRGKGKVFHFRRVSAKAEIRYVHCTVQYTKDSLSTRQLTIDFSGLGSFAGWRRAFGPLRLSKTVDSNL